MADPDRIRVLIVENEGLVGCDLGSMLTSLGYDVAAICRTGEEALPLADDLRPEVVLMDVQLAGEIDGIETARRMGHNDSVSVIYLTACADAATVARARDTQPCAYLIKPYTEDELRAALEIAVTRHRAEQQRLKLEQSFLLAFQSLADAAIVTDLAGRVMFMNTSAEEALGCTMESAAGRELSEIYSIQSADGSAGSAPKIESGAATARRLVLVRRDGRTFPIEERVAPLRDERGSVSGMVVLFCARDANAPATAPAASSGAAPLVDIVESISDPLMALDGQWRFTYVNSSAARLFNRDKRLLLGVSLWDTLPPSAHQSHYDALSAALEKRETVTREIFLEGINTWFEARTYPFGSGLLLLLKDITTRKLEAERNSRIDRLESLGLLARGFAHDFNNNLTVLLGNLALAEMRLQGQPDKLPEIQTAKQATLQAQSLVQQLLTFARGGAPIKRPVSMADLVKAFFHNHSRMNHVNYLVEVQEDLPQVAVDPNQVRRLLGNLVRNAEQALPRGGEVIVRCEGADPSTFFPNETVAELGETCAGVILEVRDNGGGIAPEHLPHVFEPYFSTRKADNATGLGLTVCESIAKAHGGSISVQSSPGTGTTVRFFLPIDAEADEADTLGIGKTFEMVPTSTPRILVLEDDNLVRGLIVRNLQSQNYEIVETVDGNDTVRAYQQAMQEGRPFHLVVLDLSIPNGMGGLRTMEKLRAMDPNVLAIVSSGYSDDPVMAQPAAYGFAAVLPKPYEPVELLRMVKGLLARRCESR
ncbi:MAG TPA: response regulator [Verrucomicrobiaceae bacterium]|jgi:PAS domain S-box-containing protein